MRPGEFFEAMDAFRSEAEAGRIHAGNLVRGLAVRIVNLFVAKKDRIRDERKYWPMPWDEEDQNAEDVARDLAQLSAEERQEKVNEFLKRINQDGSKP